MTTINFDTDGEWDAQKLRGPAVHAPTAIKDIPVTTLRVEWLDISQPENNFYAKNHMITALIFKEPVSIEDYQYSSARLSMEVDLTVTSEDQVPGVNPILLCGKHYNPGVYALTLLWYDQPAHRSAHHLTYNLKEGTTIGDLIKTIVDKMMHHFLFLLYTDEELWKGCGDHLINSWSVWVREGWITSANSLEAPNKPLHEEMTITYLSDGRNASARVGRGWWLRTNTLEDEHNPDEMNSAAEPRHRLALGN